MYAIQVLFNSSCYSASNHLLLLLHSLVPRLSPSNDDLTFDNESSQESAPRKGDPVSALLITPGVVSNGSSPCCLLNRFRWILCSWGVWRDAENLFLVLEVQITFDNESKVELSLKGEILGIRLVARPLTMS